MDNGVPWLRIEAVIAALLCKLSTVWLPISGSMAHSTDMSAGIWARYIKIDGVRYFASFANRPSGNSRLIWSPAKATSVRIMYVALALLVSIHICQYTKIATNGVV